eukprot:TRINITY_DN786_c0_g2_i2.p1 TRINITY_DN786_c0_g2~~TRINITY_DN786_c0_g2_i2.p1  ORF type:complete len:296 (+),score=108.71 TRINITY_DN786_c0_g2_i2:70-957(+)
MCIRDRYQRRVHGDLMKLLFLAGIFLFALCQEYHFFHYSAGHMVINDAPRIAVNGNILVELVQGMNISIITGLYTRGGVHTPFSIVSNTTRYVQNGKEVEIEADCWRAEWGTKFLEDFAGKMKINGTWQRISFHLKATSNGKKNTYELNATGTYAKCGFYIPSEAARRAHILINEKSETYQPVHVVNYAVFGFPYIYHVPTCKWYLDKFPETNVTKPGFLIVGKDGKHCGILDKDAENLIHSNPAKKKVTATPLPLIKDFFPQGYVIKEYKCQTCLLYTSPSPRDQRGSRMPSSA